MIRRWNIRLIFIAILLLALAARELLFEHHFVWLTPEQRMCAYVTNRGDGTLSVLDLVHLAPVATISVGPQPSDVRIRTGTNEIWGISGPGGYVWIVDPIKQRLAGKIFTGPGPSSLDFSPNGRLVYVTVAGANELVVIDGQTRRILHRAPLGRKPGSVFSTRDGKLLLIANRQDATLTILDAATWDTRATIAIAADPEKIVVLPDGSKAFIASATTDLLSVVNLRIPALILNISLGGRAADLVMKQDGGELYIPSPDAHGLLFVNTQTNEVSDYMLLGLAPRTAILAPDGRLMVEDAGAGRFVPVAPDDRVAGASVPVGEGPIAAAFSPGGEMILVVNRDSNDVAVLRGNDNSLITRIPTGRDPEGIFVLLF
jgi:YVTN family beta-propeller protein